MDPATLEGFGANTNSDLTNSDLYSHNAPRHQTEQLVADLKMRRYDWAWVDYLVLVEALKERGMPKSELVFARDRLYSLRAGNSKEDGARDISKVAAAYAKYLAAMTHVDSESTGESPMVVDGSVTHKSLNKLMTAVVGRLNGTGINLPVLRALMEEIGNQRTDYLRTISPDDVARAYQVICQHGNGFELHELARLFTRLDANPSKLEMLLRTHGSDTTVH